MDFNSGSLPLDFIPVYLDMTTEESTTEVPQLESNIAGAEQAVLTVPVGEQVGNRPPSNQSNSSSNTEGSLTFYADKTLRALAANDPSLDIAFLPPPTENVQTEKMGDDRQDAPSTDSPQKELNANRTGLTLKQGTSGGFANKNPTPDNGRDYFSTDASEFEDLYDSMGAEGVQNRPTSSIVGSDLPSFPDDPLESSKKVTEGGPAGPEGKEPKLPEQFSANGRAELRKHFSLAPPIVLPKGHTTVSFGEPQIHAVLKTISDETVKSSIHAMRSLVMHAVYGGGKQTPSQFRKGMVRGDTPARGASTSSEGEPESGGYTTDEYTSGAITSDEEQYAQTEGRRGISGPGPRLPAMQFSTASSHTTIECHTVPSPGYSEGDYIPLSKMHSDSQRHPSEASPPKKRRKLASKLDKVMKPAYFKGIQWTKIFVTGPLDPVHNKHKFYCQICKTNVSIYSKGAREIIRHYRSDAHLRKDQRWRFEHLGQIDALSGLTVHVVRGKDGRILDLKKEKPLFLTAPLVDIGPRFPIYEDYMAGVGGLKDPEDVRLATQISLIGRFVPHFGNLTVLERLWAEVGNSTNHPYTFRQLDWGSLTLTVSIVFVLSLLTQLSNRKNRWFGFPNRSP